MRNSRPPTAFRPGASLQSCVKSCERAAPNLPRSVPTRLTVVDSRMTASASASGAPPTSRRAEPSMPSPRSDDKQVPTERSLYMHHTAPCAAPPGSVPVNENASTPFNLRRHWRSRGSCGASHPGRRESTRSGVRIERPFRTMGDEGLTHEVYVYADIHARKPIRLAMTGNL